MRSVLTRLLPDLPPLSPRERLRASAGALVGILATGLVARAALGGSGSLPVLIAPMGASAVLLFAVPASPLAQPWSILAGNVVAAVTGVTAARLVADPFLAAGIAAGVAVALMLALRCLHPPSGAVALTAVLGGDAIRDLGYGFVLWPVAANSLIILATAIAFNNLTGRRYPHRAAAPGARAADGPAPAGIGFASADLDAVLREYDRVLDVGRDDLEAILHRAEMRAALRRSGRTTCADIMSRDVIAAAPGTPLREALRIMRERRVKALPVTDEGARVLGIVTQTDLLDKARWDGLGPRLGPARRLGLTLRRGRAPFGAVEDIMTVPARAVRPEMPLAAVVAEMAGVGTAGAGIAGASLHHVPVVGPEGRLVGIVSQGDVIAALLAEAAGQRAA